MRLAIALLAMAITLASASELHAQAVHVERFTGPRARVVRHQVVVALRRAGVELVSARRAAEASVTIEGRVFRVGHRWRARLRARTDDRELVDHVVTARRVGALTGIVRAWARRELPSSIGEAPPRERRAPIASPVVRADEPDAESTEPSVEQDPPRLPAPLALWLGASLTNRSFRYNDDIFASLRPYDLPIAPVVILGAEWFPGGHADLGVLSGLSVRAEGELAVGVSSLAEDGGSYATDMGAVALGVRYRLRIDDVELFADGGYRGVFFVIHDAGEQRRPDLPNVEIHAVRAGGGFRWDIGAGLFFTGQAAYLAPLAAGEITSESWFPRATFGGFEGDLGLGIRVDDVELRALFAWRRFFYAMNPEPGDRRVAGGAVDQYLSGVLSVTWIPSQLRP